jgi:ribosomal protein S18 acetylase RimI-like enzyme
MHDLRLLHENDAREFRRFRLTALEQSPQAFEESADELRSSPVAVTAERLRASSEDNFVLGAFVEGRLVGTVGFFRGRRAKTRHKGRVWGVHVDPAVRRQGIARAMMDALLARIYNVDGLRQVSLSVATTQVAAIALYESFGFKPFGLERRALCVGNDYVDEEYRVLMLDRPARL